MIGLRWPTNARIWPRTALRSRTNVRIWPVHRTGLSEKRTDLAQGRNDLAGSRTILSTYRSVLAKGRTDLAIIRTGLASIALGIALIRYFGLGLWTLLDGSLVALGAVVTLFGLRSYIVTRSRERTLSPSIDRLISAPPVSAGTETN